MGKERAVALLNKRASSWVLYDFSNSAYILLIPAVGFALYYRNVVHGGDDATTSWAILVALGYGIAGVLAPFVGALADLGLRHRLFVFATAACCALTGCLSGVEAGDVLVGGAVFVGAQVLYALAVFLYDSYLGHIAPASHAARLSGIGWGMGYLGGLACLAITWPLIKNGLKPDNLERYRLSFLVTAAFYLVFSLPAFVCLRTATSAGSRAAQSGLVVAAYRDIVHTVKGWRDHRQAFLFLIGFYCLSDAIVTVIYFTAIYLQTEWSYSVADTLKITVVIQALGIPATILFGYIGDRWSLKKTIMLTIAIWAAVILSMALLTSAYTPWLVAGLMGLVLGSTQSLCRAAYALIIPSNKASEFFGFNAFASRVSTILGPLLFGLVATWTGSQRIGLLSLLLFFGAGAVLLSLVRFPDKRARAKSATVLEEPVRYDDAPY